MIYMYNDDTNEDKSFVHNSHFVRQKKCVAQWYDLGESHRLLGFKLRIHYIELLFYIITYSEKVALSVCVCGGGGGGGTGYCRRLGMFIVSRV